MRLVWTIIPLVVFSIIGISESFAQESEFITSPKHQLESGIAPEDIICRDNRVLVLRTNGNTVCVKETTSEKLGWKIIKQGSSVIEIKSKLNQDLTPIDLLDSDNIIDANNQFAIDFYSKISSESDENIFFSPWSISTAFAIAFEGAKGNTADEIRQVFGFPSDYEKRTSQFKSAINNLNSDDSKYQLSVANALWLAEKFEPFAEYVETATNFYDSEVSTVDFISNDGVDQINAWVEDKTQEKIKDILKPGSTDEDTRLAITNAIYFKGSWVTQFNENNTRSDTFWNGETTSEIPLMHLEPTTLFNYTQTDQLQILKMPYDGDKLSMLVLLPNENDGLDTLEESLSIENLNLWREQLTTQQVEVFMPKFNLETTYDLKTSLSKMGMPTPFSEGIANFGGIAPVSLYISQAVHKAFVDVNEEGTEAAAATVIVITEESYKPPPPVFRADHPFVFLIQDDSTGNILFIGRMINPSE